jgi:hypothetical protein
MADAAAVVAAAATAQQQLAQYRLQLAQLEAAIRALPEAQPKLVAAREQLQQLIALTEEVARDAASGALPLAALAPPPPAPPPPPPAAAAAAAPPASGPPRWELGDRCLAPWEDGRLHIARIAEIDAERVNAKVVFLVYGSAGAAPLAELRPFKPAAPALLARDTHVVALWAADGKFYDARIDSALPGGRYNVVFRGYRDKIAVAAADICLRASEPREGEGEGAGEAAGGDAAAGADASEEENDDATPADFVVPDHLRILPTDTERARESKRRQLRQLKKAFKRKRAESEQVRRQSSWQSFAKRARVVGALNRRSIFAAPETPDGRVGVTGSGRDMTEVAGPREFANLRARVQTARAPEGDA